MKIAVVDDGVNRENIIYGEKIHIYSLAVKDNEVKQCDFENNITHGTMCIAILCKYLNEANIYSIKVKDYKNNGDIESVICALHWCIDNQVNVINMSLGTQKYSDYAKINCIVGKVLCYNKYLVAAESNNGKYTLPACLPNVIGVESHYKEKELVLKSHRWESGVNVSAYGKGEIFLKNKKVMLDASNSYACAYVTAKVANILSKSKKESIGSILYDIIKNKINAGSILRCSQMDGIYHPFFLGKNEEILYKYIKCESYTKLLEKYSVEKLIEVREVIICSKCNSIKTIKILKKMKNLYLVVYCGVMPLGLRFYIRKKKILYWDEKGQKRFYIRKKIGIPIVIFEGEYEDVIHIVEQVVVILENDGFDVGKISDIKYSYLYGYEFYYNKKEFWRKVNKCQDVFSYDLLLIATQKWKINVDNLMISVLGKNKCSLDKRIYENNMCGLVDEIIRKLS